MSKQILAFVGMMGSGKGTAVSYFTDKGYPHIYFGGFVYEEIEKRGLDKIKDETEVRRNMREVEGPTVMAKRAAERANEYFSKGALTVVFDGIYTMEEYEYLKEAFGETLNVIAIVTGRTLRHQRILERTDGRNYTPEQIVTREHDEVVNMNKGGPIAMADHYIDNNRTLEEFNAQLDALNKKLIEKAAE